MSKCAIYDHNIGVKIKRNGIEMTVPFCELREGDVVDDNVSFTVGTDAHQCEDPHYEGWLVYDNEDNGYFPEDFGADQMGTADKKKEEANNK